MKVLTYQSKMGHCFREVFCGDTDHTSVVQELQVLSNVQRSHDFVDGMIERTHPNVIALRLDRQMHELGVSRCQEVHIPLLEYTDSFAEDLQYAMRAERFHCFRNRRKDVLDCSISEKQQSTSKNEHTEGWLKR